MGLKLAAKKSYHPGKEANKARVARDEQKEAESRDSKLAAERSDRFNELRLKAGLADVIVEAHREIKHQPVGSVQTFNDVVEPKERISRKVNKMDPDQAKAKMDPLADMNRYLEETEKWEKTGDGDEPHEQGDDRVHEALRSERRHRSRRKKRCHRVTKER